MTKTLFARDNKFVFKKKINKICECQTGQKSIIKYIYKYTHTEIVVLIIRLLYLLTVWIESQSHHEI